MEATHSFLSYKNAPSHLCVSKEKVIRSLLSEREIAYIERERERERERESEREIERERERERARER